MTDERDYTPYGMNEAFDEELPREPLGAHAEPAMPAAAPARLGGRNDPPD